MKKFLLIILLLFFFFPEVVLAQNCDNRYVTLVNPVRARSLWKDNALKPLVDQYEAVASNNLPATWLLQYDAINDESIKSKILGMNELQEIGIFLEVSNNLANDSRVIYPYNAEWFSPNAVFLSGYSQSGRRKLVDQLFINFKKNFGYFPKSVGAWWIDSYSLNYMKQKYGVTTAMIVADQTSTDNYGVWGQWWGVPYYPTIANILTPASDLKNKQNVVVIQWAQRDPVLGYGEGKASLYSLQANDYLQVGKDLDYFKDIASVYLDCQNPIGQITVGIETGIESVNFIDEYKNQLNVVKNISALKPVTMSEFAQKFAYVYPTFPNEEILSSQSSKWLLKPGFRESMVLKDRISYQSNVSFKDYFVADKSGFLDRRLNRLTPKANDSYKSWFLIVILGFAIFAFLKRQFKAWTLGTAFLIASFGLLLRSGSDLGWQVFYGPITQNLIIWQLVVVAESYLLFWYLGRVKSRSQNLSWLIILSFGIDAFINLLRVSYISGKYYLGVSPDALRFIGFSFEKPLTIQFINQDFPSFLSAGFLRFNFDKIWDNFYLSVFFYPLIHILIGFILSLVVLKLPSKISQVILILLSIFLIIHISNIFLADPRLVQ